MALRRLVVLVVVMSVVSAYSETRPSGTDLLRPARSAFTAAQNELRSTPNPNVGISEPGPIRHYADLLVETGQQDKALQLLDRITTPDVDTQLAIATILLSIHQYPKAGALIEDLNRQYPENHRVRALEYRWCITRGDLTRVDAALQTRTTKGRIEIVDQITGADLKLRMLNYGAAYDAYSKLASVDLDKDTRIRVTRGLGVALFHLQRYDESLQQLEEALKLGPSDEDTIAAMADTLLRLGRINEAIDTLKFTLQVSPWNERVHRLLGSGFTTMNYSQLFTAFPTNFADKEGLEALAKGDKALRERRVDTARHLYLAVATAHPNWADAEVRLGSLEYEEQNFAAARDHYWRALQLCPDYGRAHDGLAISFEALRLQVDVHHEQDETSLNAAPMPAIPHIERYVLNWHSLSSRHQKRLALSIEPWARYIPALELAGATMYVKPPYQLLSRAPYQELLKDKRIDYDTRLWDDVRGDGGFHTVVGLEDVETRISDGYDTMLHEMSHQVHAILSPEWTRKIQALYAETTRRQAKSGDAFLSQYAASSVWEYFAEGANSLYTPRRDRYDTREMVRERLEERDPALLALTEEIMDKANVVPSFALALVRLGDNRLSEGKPKQADAVYRKALTRAPDDEAALVARMRVLPILGRGEEAAALAATAYSRHRNSGSIAVERAYIDWLEGVDPAKVIDFLKQARTDVRSDEQYLVDLRIGELSSSVGDMAQAEASFNRVLAYQPDNPEALAGLGEAEASSGHWDEAWKEYDKALRVRSGAVRFHVMYARDLIRAGDLSRAQQEVDRGLLLDPEDADVLAIQAWQLLSMGKSADGLQIASKARDLDPWNPVADIVAAAAERRAGNPETAEKIMKPVDERLRGHIRPRYIYRRKQAGYELIYTLSADDRKLIQETGAAAN